MSSTRETRRVPDVVAPRALAVATFLLPVAAVAVLASCLLRADAALTAGVDDLDPLYGLTTLLVVVGAVVVGAGNLVLAALHCFRPTVVLSTGVAVAGAVWTAATGVSLVLLVTVASAADPALEGSRTAGDQVPWAAAAVVVAVLPLAVALVVHRAARRDTMF
ncbi:hypothetical protein [Nocardioides sp. 1609]|uniref:hypothetical protein n=1 Tax=Nocardioides sp. 1609 TaxID=2508327 RepID=UPI00106F76F8|nr:hypothetical protein [Nocardioides sp. 1609]